MKSKLLLIVLNVTLTVSCSSFSLYKKSDCEFSAEHYGRCYADLGYKPLGFEGLSNYCTQHKITLDQDKFLQARAKRLKEKCSQPNEVFALAFRSAARLNGPDACPEIFLTTSTLRKANEDGKESGTKFLESKSFAKEAKTAEARREEADHKGFWSGLEDRLLNTNADDLRAVSSNSSMESKNILDRYQNVNQYKLTENLKCTPSGYF